MSEDPPKVIAALNPPPSLTNREAQLMAEIGAPNSVASFNSVETNSRVEIFEDTKGEWRFRIKGGNGEIVAASEGS